MSQRALDASLPIDLGSGRRALRSLWVAGAVGGFAQSLSGSTGALLVREVTGTDTAAGLPQTALVIGAALSALALSALTRVRGRAFALSLGLAIAVVGSVLSGLGGLTAGVPAILVGNLLLGAGTTAVMLGRYAAADLGTEADRPRTMASVLTATTVGAVLGPNLLAPAGSWGTSVGLPALVGPYLVAALGFAVVVPVLAFGLRPSGVVPAGPVEPTLPPLPDGRARLGRQGAAGLVVLAVANLVMVAVMAMAPVQMHHAGHGLAAIGLVISLHIAGMFAPSPLSGRLTARWGAPRVSLAAGAVLTLACGLAAAGARSSVLLPVGLVTLGVGWNLALISGSVLLTDGASPVDRARREGWGEVGMGAAAAGGGATSGLLMATGGYPTLAAAGAAAATLVIPSIWLLSRPGRRGSPDPRR